MTGEPTQTGFLAFLRMTLVVTLVSVLIWIVAEGESLSRERVEVVVRLVHDEGEMAMRPAPGSQWTGRVVMEIEGSTAELSRLRELLRDVIELSPGDEGVPVEPGEHTINLAEVLRSIEPMVESGVSITGIEPETVGVLVDRVEWQSFEVRVDMPELASASSPAAEPARVRVLVPSLLSESIADLRTLHASLTREQVDGLDVGERNVIPNVPIDLPDALSGHPFVRVEPERVSVTVTLESRVESITLDTVPVQIQKPAFEAELWTVHVEGEDQLLEGVTVTGPSELIDRIRSGELTIFATVVLTLDDRDAGITQKEAVFTNLPTPLEFEAPDTTVRLSIRSVADAEDAGPTPE